jgi:hypothetical protein
LSYLARDLLSQVTCGPHVIKFGDTYFRAEIQFLIVGSVRVNDYINSCRKCVLMQVLFTTGTKHVNTVDRDMEADKPQNDELSTAVTLRVTMSAGVTTATARKQSAVCHTVNF